MSLSGTIMRVDSRIMDSRIINWIAVQNGATVVLHRAAMQGMKRLLCAYSTCQYTGFCI
jgi:hypothetical protein